MAYSPSSNLPSPEAIQAELVLELDFYCEGPAVDENGGLYFTDLAGESIRYFDQGNSYPWAKGRRPNGQAIKRNGDHLICDSSLGTVLCYSESGKLRNRACPSKIDGIKIRCPNDIVLDGEGGFFFTDSVRHNGAVYHVDGYGKSSCLATDIDFANGIAHDRELNFLYVAESYKNRILKLDLNQKKDKDGFLSIFSELPQNESNPLTGNLPDGMRLDQEGRLWVAHYGMQSIQVLSKNGLLLATYDTGIPLTSNLCFRGAEVWVTGGLKEPGPGRITKIATGVKGYPLI